VGDRALGTAGKIAEKAGIIHIDIDPAEIGKNVITTITCSRDAGLILETCISLFKTAILHNGWRACSRLLKRTKLN
jgi:acetolactate synthase-1/2/3 large subunit